MVTKRTPDTKIYVEDINPAGNKTILFIHGINYQVCLFPLAIAQKNSIKNSKLVPFEACGHFLFYDQRDRFNKELVQFIEEWNGYIIW